MADIPDRTAVQQQLERVLSSELFASAGRHSRVLRYLVNRTLAGEGDQLKEYVLGTEVFDRDDAYDPRIDSIVRVEVRRLRARLEDFYRGPGAADRLVICIPRGTYVPVFTTRQPVPAGTPAPGPVFTPTSPSVARRSPARFAMIAGATAFSIVLLIVLLVFNSDRSPAAASTKTAVAVLPFDSYSSDPRGALLAARMTDAVTAELARLGTVSVASRTSASQFTGQRPAIPAIAHALKVDFVLESSALSTGDHIRVSARMVDALTDRKIWVGDYDVAAGEIERSARRIAQEAAAGILVYRQSTR